MKKHIIWLAAIPLIATVMININPVFADTTYGSELEQCYRYFDEEDVAILDWPVGCIAESKAEGVNNFIVGDSSIFEITASGRDTFIFNAKKVGVTSVEAVVGSESFTSSMWTSDVRSDTPWIITNAVKQYIVSNYKEDFFVDCGENHCTYVNLNIENLDENDLTNEEKTKINEILDGETILAYGDITLNIEDGEGNSIESIDQLVSWCDEGSDTQDVVCHQETIDVKWGGLNLGKPAAGYKRNFYVIQLHNGEAIKIPAEVDEEGNLVFPSGKFSVYAVVYEDVEAEEEPEKVGEKASAPNTGSSMESSGDMTLSLIGCMVAGVGLSFMMFSKVRKYIKK